MKKVINSATFLLILMAGSFIARGQDTGNNSGTSLFGKGTWLINLHNPISFSAYTDKYAHSDYRNSDFRLNFEHYYFFRNNMGAGLNFDWARFVSNTSYKRIGTSAMIYASYLQGFEIGGLDFLAKASIGIGKTKEVNKTIPGNDVISNLRAFKIEAGPVFKLSDNQSMLFEPTVGFMYDISSFRDYTARSPEFIVRANLIFNLGYNDFNCDSKSGPEDSRLRIASGMNTFSASTMFDARFGGLTEEFASYDNEYIINSQSLLFNYRHFVADGLSLGAFASIVNNYQKSTEVSETSSNSRNTDFIIGPAATWYPFTGKKCLGNIFADLNIGIGENVSKSFNTKVKAGVFGGYIDAGYDLGISKNLSLDPAFGFRIYRFDYPGTTLDYTQLGPFFSLGLKATF